MKRRILLTGGTGFIGKNIISILAENVEVFSPGRTELNLMDAREIRKFLKENNIDVVVHSANPNPKKNPGFDSVSTFLVDSLRMFINLYDLRGDYEKLIYLGSGAEYDKSLPISKITEEEIGRSVPSDDYGFGKYLMNELAAKSNNVYNFRLFACYGPYDHASKFITHCIRSVLDDQDISIRQDCVFDYLHVFDLGRIINYGINNDLTCADYNIGSGHTVALENVAQLVLDTMESDRKLSFQNTGMNLEYTPCIDRLIADMPSVASFMSLEEGIRKQIDFEKKHYRKEQAE